MNQECCWPTIDTGMYWPCIQGCNTWYILHFDANAKNYKNNGSHQAYKRERCINVRSAGHPKGLLCTCVCTFFLFPPISVIDSERKECLGSFFWLKTSLNTIWQGLNVHVMLMTIDMAVYPFYFFGEHWNSTSCTVHTECCQAIFT